MIELRKYKNRKVVIVADGPSCPDLFRDDESVYIAVNHGYRSLEGKPDFIVFNDYNFIKEFRGSTSLPLCSVATWLVHDKKYTIDCYNSLKVRLSASVTRSIEEGVYGPWSSGLSALSFALLLEPREVHLFGYDYRVFSPEESLEFFGFEVEDHKSDAVHRGVTEPVLKQKIKYFDVYKDLMIPVVNHSEHSAIPYFSKVKL